MNVDTLNPEAAIYHPPPRTAGSSRKSIISGKFSEKADDSQSAVVEGLPFELKCIETMLATVIRVHRLELDDLEIQSTAYLTAMKGSSLLTTDQQEFLRELKENLGRTTQRVENLTNLLTELLSDDVAMTFTMLSALAKNPDLYQQYK
jgi:hypothetical protein